jgi:hypothetical protein
MYRILAANQEVRERRDHLRLRAACGVHQVRNDRRRRAAELARVPIGVAQLGRGSRARAVDGFRLADGDCGHIRATAVAHLVFLWTTWLTKASVVSMAVPGGASMKPIERNEGADPVHDFAWHQAHRARRGWQSIDVVMLAGWAGLVGWVLLRH